MRHIFSPDLRNLFSCTKSSFIEPCFFVSISSFGLINSFNGISHFRLFVRLKIHNKFFCLPMNKLPSDMELTIHSPHYSDRHPLISKFKQNSSPHGRFFPPINKIKRLQCTRLDRRQMFTFILMREKKLANKNVENQVPIDPIVLVLFTTH